MIASGILALLATIGIAYISALASGTAFSNSILSVFVFAGLYLLLKATTGRIRKIDDGKERKRRIFYAEAAAYIFALTMVTGYQLKAYGMTECGFRGKGMILVRAFCLSAAVFPAAYAFFAGLSTLSAAGRRKLPAQQKPAVQQGLPAQGDAPGKPGMGGRILLFMQGEHRANEWNSRKVFLFCLLVIFACWLPVFLAYYPAVMAYDFHKQSIEATFGPPYFNSHHPLAHTLLIWVFFQAGGLFGSLETGMAFYSIFQMLVLSLAFAYACAMVYRLCKKKAAVVVVAAFYALFPYNSILAVSVTKDVIFGALFLVFLLLLIERVHFGKQHNKNLLDLAILLEGVLMMLFRNNAIYAVAVFSVFFVLFTEKKERIRVLVLCILLVVLSKASLEGMYSALGGLGKGSGAEKYSVVIQQFARVGFYHGKNLDSETYGLLDTYVPHEYWGNYNPPISDSVKIFVTSTSFGTWEKDMPAMWRAWAKIGRQYPNEFLDAFFCLTAGYWFLDDVTWAECLGVGPEERLGALYTFNSTVSEVIPEGIAHESKFPWLENRLEEIVSSNAFYRWPVVSALFKPSFYCWMLALCAAACVYLKRRQELMLTLLPLVYLGTLLLGPVALVRYMMCIMTAVPVLAAMLLGEGIRRI